VPPVPVFAIVSPLRLTTLPDGSKEICLEYSTAFEVESITNLRRKAAFPSSHTNALAPSECIKAANGATKAQYRIHMRRRIHAYEKEDACMLTHLDVS
jgi:hypothetical protein